VEVRNDTPNSSPSRDLFIDTLTVILVSNHETDPPKQQETETIPRTPSLIRDEPDDQQILSADKIWHPPVSDLSKLNEKEVMNLCIHCLQTPKYVEPDGRIYEYYMKHCTISAGALPFLRVNKPRPFVRPVGDFFVPEKGFKILE
jgi:hypothetical protein